ncbi:hypothetical protein BDV27DRAFT_154367 [Aspergillus caelatus]|uniref:Uncharacterized protein n=1 Tax=Aspergillus caelatus TaxID=61420 RepID=A0A5N7AG36_9EURO|nr:uncharacterized protein BDV27DRAFT_154367 [Aspergillus caelatus]KAE8368039.1 hypothetical protein BDV27DRAFT_154367 [Aspergillus caelatus]
MADSKKLDTDAIHQRCSALAVANQPNRWLPESGSDTSYTSSREGTPDTVDTVVIRPQTRPGTPDTLEFPSPPPGTPTLRSPRRRNQEQRKPALSGVCSDRYTSISLDSCLGWNPANGGSFVAQRYGKGMEKGDCHTCQYERGRGVGEFVITCLCENTPRREYIAGRESPRRRNFTQPGVITIDKNNRFRCFDITGV